MNETQIKLLQYLGAPERSERDKVYEDLCWLLGDTMTDSYTKSEIEKYLRENERKFCTTGINNAAKLFGINLAKKWKLLDNTGQYAKSKDFKPGTLVKGRRTGKVYIAVSDGRWLAQDGGWHATTEGDVVYIPEGN